jgi:hypothetical protein
VGPLKNDHRGREKELDTLHEKFAAALRERKELKERWDQLVEEESRIHDLKDTIIEGGLIHGLEGQAAVEEYDTIYMGSEIPDEYPIILNESRYALAIFDLGALPPSDAPGFVLPGCIYPIGYRSKRSYKSNRGNGYVLYDCGVDMEDNDLSFYIKSKDGISVRGKDDVWERFCAHFDDEVVFDTLEDFMGLNNLHVQRYIEGLGNISSYRNYVPVNERAKNIHWRN